MMVGVRARQASVANIRIAKRTPTRIGVEHGKLKLAALASKTVIKSMVSRMRERCSPMMIGNCTVLFPADVA